MNNKIVYTSIFGGFDDIQKVTVPSNWDFKCFSENNSLPLYKDSNRNAKKFKLLPHRYLSNYEYSIWIDGNFKITGDIDVLVDKYLSDSNIAFFNHQNTTIDSRNCIYQEAAAIFQLGEINMKRSPERGTKNYKDDPNVINKQIQRYYADNYPQNNGLIKGGIIIRRHNEADVINAMERWWNEVKYNSKRDQLSFNYVAWKQNLKFNYIDGDLRNNEFFDHTGHTGKK
jgi:hypothetical protein